MDEVKRLKSELEENCVRFKKTKIILYENFVELLLSKKRQFARISGREENIFSLELDEILEELNEELRFLK